jgi:AcrR family transcriptional regulator
MYKWVQKRASHAKEVPVRVKTAQRRQAIVEAAASVFQEKGFDRSSMDAIAARAGGSKATLYSYYPSKEELFFAVVEHMLHAQAEAPLDALAEEGSLRDRLTRFARRHVASRLHDDVIALDRMLIAEAERSNLGDLVRVRCAAPRVQRLAEMLQLEMAAGRLRPANPYRAATQFRLLAEGDLVERRLHGDKSINAEAASAEAAEGLDAFLRAYTPDTDGPADAVHRAIAKPKSEFGD